MEKKAAYKEAFLNRIFPKATLEVLKATRPDRIKGLQHENVSLIGAALGMAREGGAVGANAINDGLNKARLAISDLDTGLGHLAAGKTYGKPKGQRSLRASIFTDSDNMIDRGNNMWQKVELPSITAPVKTVGTAALLSMGYYKGIEVGEDFKNYFRKSKAVQNGQRTPENGGGVMP
jgi:hypothetical protein